MQSLFISSEGVAALGLPLPSWIRHATVEEIEWLRLESGSNFTLSVAELARRWAAMFKDSLGVEYAVMTVLDCAPAWALYTATHRLRVRFLESED